MSVPAVTLRPWTVGPDPVTPTAGVDGLAMLVPVAEPVSVGACPVRPTLVKQMMVGFGVREARTVSGHTRTRPVYTRQRPEFQVGWSSLTLAQRNTVYTWWMSTLRGTLLAFSLDVDGEGNGAVKVRCKGSMREVWMTRGGGTSATESMVFNLDVDVEEVF